MQILFILKGVYSICVQYIYLFHAHQTYFWMHWFTLQLRGFISDVLRLFKPHMTLVTCCESCTETLQPFMKL